MLELILVNVIVQQVVGWAIAYRIIVMEIEGE